MVLCNVDDCLIFAKNEELINTFIKQLQDAKLTLTVEDTVHAFLGVDVGTVQNGSNKGKTILTQKGLKEKLCKYVGVWGGNSVKVPAASETLGADANGDPFSEQWSYASAVGMAMYLTSNIHPEFQFAVHQCARFTHAPKASHAKVLKRICRYLMRHMNDGLVFHPTHDLKLDCYVDADFAEL